MKCGELGVQEVTITGPCEKFQPIAFHSLDLSQISVKLICSPEDDFEEVCSRARNHIEAEQKKNFELQSKEYWKRAVELSAKVRQK